MRWNSNITIVLPFANNQIFFIIYLQSGSIATVVYWEHWSKGLLWFLPWGKIINLDSTDHYLRQMNHLFVLWLANESKAVVSQLGNGTSFLFILVDWNCEFTPKATLVTALFHSNRNNNNWKATEEPQFVVALQLWREMALIAAPVQDLVENFILNINIGQLALPDTVSFSMTLPAA